jgi:hypothetical protein
MCQVRLGELQNPQSRWLTQATDELHRRVRESATALVARRRGSRIDGGRYSGPSNRFFRL